MRHRVARTVGLAAALVLAAGLVTATRNVDAAPGSPPVITSISAGGDHSCALTAQAAALCWGSNRSGELGDGSTSSARRPTAVAGLTEPLGSISAGTFHTCAVGTSGQVWCWGRFVVGGSGTSLLPARVVGLSGITAVASGRLHACGLTAEGGVMCWGRNTKGQLGNGTSASSVGLSGPRAVVGLSTGVTEIVAGDAYSCAVTTAGRVKCWGDNQFGQLGNGTTNASIVPVEVVGLKEAHGLAAGGLHACAHHRIGPDGLLGPQQLRPAR